MELKLTKPLIVFDIESTGVNVGHDRIIELCLCKVNIDNTTTVKTYRVNPGIPIPYFASLIHNIYDKDIADKPFFKDLAHEIAQFIGNADLGGYNSNKFDIPLLVEEFLRAGIDFEIKNRSLVDVQNIFHRMEPRTLKAAYKFYCGKNLENAHSAEADTLATYEILKAQIEKYENAEYENSNGDITLPIQNDIKALHDFTANFSWVDLAGHISMNEKGQEVFNFGKHKGKPLEDVFKAEPSYYSWMMDADFPLYTKKILTAIRMRAMNNSL